MDRSSRQVRASLANLQFRVWDGPTLLCYAFPVVCSKERASFIPVVAVPLMLNVECLDAAAAPTTAAATPVATPAAAVAPAAPGALGSTATTAAYTATPTLTPATLVSPPATGSQAGAVAAGPDTAAPTGGWNTAAAKVCTIKSDMLTTTVILNNLPKRSPANCSW